MSRDETDKVISEDVAPASLKEKAKEALQLWQVLTPRGRKVAVGVTALLFAGSSAAVFSLMPHSTPDEKTDDRITIGCVPGLISNGSVAAEQTERLIGKISDNTGLGAEAQAFIAGPGSEAMSKLVTANQAHSIGQTCLKGTTINDGGDIRMKFAITVDGNTITENGQGKK